MNSNRGATVAVLIFGMFVVILNQTMINVAIPKMMNDLNVSTTTIQWLSTGFMLANAVMIPISAFLMETIPTRTLFITAMALFTAGSLICGIGSSFALILVGRIVQAIAAGLMMPLVTSIFLRIFPPEKMGSAMGMMGVAMMFAPALGPTFAGWVIEHFSWRVLFFIMVPLGLIEVVLAFRLLSNVLKLTYPKLDWPGVVFSTIGFGSLLYGLSEAGSKGWGSAVVLSTIVIGILFLVFFVWRQLTAKTPLLNLRVFTVYLFSMTTLVSVVINIAMFGAMLLLPIYIQNIRGYTALQSGLLMLPGAVIMGIMSPISGALFDKIGVRPLAIIGLAITTVTTYEFTHLTDGTSYSHLMVLYMLRSFGMSFIMMTIMTAGLNALPIEMKSHGSAVSNTIRQVASSLGTALLITVESTRANAHIANYVNSITLNNPIAADNFASFERAIAGLTGLPPDVGAAYAITLISGLATKLSTIEGINDSFVVAMCITALGVIFSLFLSRPKKQPKPAK
ncbi:DHA2 family efflux MFS transporter permease subunit [Cohnella sp. AR92]|uniref:DHA2 family efflux MFS transporter permease subunit n=1 Tax=Cohnella sp. AR92 TaxID=648716 RepID=UPI000F8EE8C6|nr:DHA2 family efflux MFS transporter permease subunit [Cohnella sp. AR92]RUS48826.1 DHA2 family efflux MFS transporter permease subunit [Cohnella sp. AR92]